MTNLSRRRANDLMALRDNFFDNFFSDNFFSEVPRQSQFKVDIKETDEGYELMADLPGFNKEDLSLTYDQQVLTIEAFRDEEKEEQDERGVYIRKERSTSSFRRQFLIKDLDRESITAKFENGVLHLELPKQKAVVKEASRIEIE